MTTRLMASLVTSQSELIIFISGQIMVLICRRSSTGYGLILLLILAQARGVLPNMRYAGFEQAAPSQQVRGRWMAGVIKGSKVTSGEGSLESACRNKGGRAQCRLLTYM